MELVLEIQKTRQLIPHHARSHAFTTEGGMIGRASDCDWVVPDTKKHLSGHHAKISFKRGMFYLTDISRNGVLTGSGVQLPKGEPHRIEHDSIFQLCDFEIRARLVRERKRYEGEVGRAQPVGSVIPDDAFLGVEPFRALQEPSQHVELDELQATYGWGEPLQSGDHAGVDTESLMVPELVAASSLAQRLPQAAPTVAESASAQFWLDVGKTLGVDFIGLDNAEREALAIKAAALLAQCIAGLQQSLRTHADLKNELRLSQTTTPSVNRNPLKQGLDTAQALSLLLQPSRPGQDTGEQAVACAFHDLQAHQVAVTAGSRAVVRATLEHFAPEQLSLRFERDPSKPLFTTAGSKWRAYGRYHQALRLDDGFGERLIARDFAEAYEEQLRLIAFLHTEHKG